MFNILDLMGHTGLIVNVINRNILRNYRSCIFVFLREDISIARLKDTESGEIIKAL